MWVHGNKNVAISRFVSFTQGIRTLYHHQKQLLEGTGCLNLERLKIIFLHTFQVVVKYAVIYPRTFSVCLFIIRIASYITQMINLSAKFSKFPGIFSSASFLLSYLLIWGDLFNSFLKNPYHMHLDPVSKRICF